MSNNNQIVKKTFAKKEKNR